MTEPNDFKECLECIKISLAKIKEAYEQVDVHLDKIDNSYNAISYDIGIMEGLLREKKLIP